MSEWAGSFDDYQRDYEALMAWRYPHVHMHHYDYRDRVFKCECGATQLVTKLSYNTRYELT